MCPIHLPVLHVQLPGGEAGILGGHDPRKEMGKAGGLGGLMADPLEAQSGSPVGECGWETAPSGGPQLPSVRARACLGQGDPRPGNV